MKFGCSCGYTIRDQTDFIPYKAHFFADQDYDDVLDDIASKLEEEWHQPDAPASHISASERRRWLIHTMLNPYRRELYQCPNCGRIFIDDPDDELEFQTFVPDREQWKKVLASVNGEASKPWKRNLVAHWNVETNSGQLWYDPIVGERGGLESFNDWEMMKQRYFDLFDRLRADHNLVGARFGVYADGKINDIHNWQKRNADVLPSDTE